MLGEKEQIRNEKGKLLCELAYDDSLWYVDIKKGMCFTSLILYPDGSFRVANES